MEEKYNPRLERMIQKFKRISKEKQQENKRFVTKAEKKRYKERINKERKLQSAKFKKK